MRRWIIGIIGVLAIASLGADCYDRPTCSFRCGPQSSCPYEYECASDGWCKLKGTPDNYQCSGHVPEVDAGPEIDAE